MGIRVRSGEGRVPGPVMGPVRLLLPALPLLAAVAAPAGHPCPAEWTAVCPGEPCTPLPTPYPKREVMAWHAGSFGGCGAGCSINDWTHYNYSVVTTMVLFTGQPCLPPAPHPRLLADHLSPRRRGEHDANRLRDAQARHPCGPCWLRRPQRVQANLLRFRHRVVSAAAPFPAF